MRKSLMIIATLLGSVFLFFSGCNKAANEETGRLIVKITDEAFPIDVLEEASVTITKVEMRNETEDEESEVSETSEASPFITLFEGSETFNLVELRNGMMAAFLDLEIPAGNYNLIRIFVENASISITDYDTYTVKVPSGSQTGVKVFIKPSLTVSGGLTSEVILDFSLDKSFVLQGNPDTPADIRGFNFKPVIRAVNSSFAGTVHGVVKDAEEQPLGGVKVSIMQDEVISTAYTDEDDGTYVLPAIPAGMYTMTAELEGYVTVTAEEIEVIEGNSTTQDFVLEAETTGK